MLQLPIGGALLEHMVYDDEAALVASSHEALRDLETLFEADTAPEPDEGEPPR